MRTLLSVREGKALKAGRSQRSLITGSESDSKAVEYRGEKGCVTASCKALSLRGFDGFIREKLPLPASGRPGS